MDEKQKLNAIVNSLVNATDPQEVKSTYKAWADSYNKDLHAFGYVAPQIGVTLLSKQLKDKNALIHDAGCGTGLVGALLNELGYKQIHGSDFSPDMLDKASLAGHYTDLQNLDFSSPISIASQTYDAVISIGVYTKRFNQHFISEMMRITRPAGHFVFSCREIYYEEVMDSISSLLKACEIKRAFIEHDEYMTGQDVSAYYICIEK